MNKTSVLLSAVTGLASLGTTSSLHAASYADLLTPIENPVAALQADDTARATEAQYYYYGQPGYGYGYGGGYGWGYGRRPWYHHHHHHHHHSYYHHHHHHHSYYRHGSYR